MLETIVNKGAEPVRWLIVAGIAYTLASTTWTFFAAPTAPAFSSARPTQTDTPTRDQGNVNWILGKNLFGKAGAQPLQDEADSGQTEKVTTLPLELQSVFVSDEPENSNAIVAQKGKPGQVYHVGDKVPGNATLLEVHGDRIVLRRGGSREALFFPKSKLELVQYPEPQMAKPPQNPTESRRADAAAAKLESPPTEMLNEYRQRLREDAEGTLDDLGIESVDSGGYRIGAGNAAQLPYVRQAGLQPGDVILSVNGRPVGNAQQDQLELDNIMAQGSARIEVQRGSRRFFITASLK